MLSLVTRPLSIGLSVAGNLARFAVSRLAGTRSGPAPAPTPPPPATSGRPEPVDSTATDWSDDAPVPPGGSSPDDPLIADRVKTEIFRDQNAPKGDVNVNVENGVVFLRGEVDDAEKLEEMVLIAESVEGVVGVENLVNQS